MITVAAYFSLPVVTALVRRVGSGEGQAPPQIIVINFFVPTQHPIFTVGGVGGDQSYPANIIIGANNYSNGSLYIH